MFFGRKYRWQIDTTQPFGFVIVDENGISHNPIELARNCNVEIIFDPVSKHYWLQGDDMPWYTPLPKKRAREFAALIGVVPKRLRYDY